MKLLIACACAVLSVACAGRLENTYLPPSNAASAGGRGLAAPFGAASSGFGKSAPAPPVAILKYSNENNGDGTYNYNYETADGTSAQQSGYLKNAGNPETEAQVVEGSYSFTGADGVVYTVNYIADENGYRATGAHLPTPPPVPEAIQRSLEVIAAAEAAKTRNSAGPAKGGFAGYSGAATGQQGYSYLPPQ